MTTQISDRRNRRQRPRRHLVVMVKLPVAGRVKTRLASETGVALATRFARTSALSVIGRLSQPRRWQLHLAIDPPRGLASRALPTGFERLAQLCGDLGVRMQDICDRPLRGPVVIVGADIPALSAAHVAAAFGALGCHDAVFGPASDGGYWLAGLKRFPGVPRAFGGVRWSSEHALADTMRNLGGRKVALLEVLDDVDCAADLRRLGCFVGRRVLPRGAVHSRQGSKA